LQFVPRRAWTLVRVAECITRDDRPVLAGTLSLRTHEQNYHTTLLHRNGLPTSNNVQRENNLGNKHLSLWI